MKLPLRSLALLATFTLALPTLAQTGAKPADTAATVDYDVTRRVKIQGEAGSDGRTAVGVGAEWEY